MIENESYGCEKKCKCSNIKSCFEMVFWVVSVALAFTVGLLIGARISATILGALTSIYVLIGVLTLMAIFSVILLIYNNVFRN